MAPNLRALLLRECWQNWSAIMPWTLERGWFCDRCGVSERALRGGDRLEVLVITFEEIECHICPACIGAVRKFLAERPEGDPRLAAKRYTVEITFTASDGKDEPVTFEIPIEIARRMQELAMHKRPIGAVILNGPSSSIVWTQEDPAFSIAGLHARKEAS